MSPRPLTLFQSEFFRNVSYQMFGTGVAQVLPFAVTPILTRLYTEDDFAKYTTFFAIASILVVGAGGRYQYAIVLPKKRSEAIHIFTLSCYITVAYSILVWAAVFVFASSPTVKTLGRLVHFLPLYVLCFGIWTSFSNLSVRRKTFFRNAVAKVLQSIGYVVPALGFGFVGLASVGLVAGRTFGALLSAAYLFVHSEVKAMYIPFRRLARVARSYKSYPQYGLVPAFLDVASVQGLILVLTRFYSTDDLGFFGLTTLVLSAPLGLIGTSFKDVFYQKITALLQNDQAERARELFKRSAAGLFIVGLPICAIIFFFGPELFALVFGEKWRRAGVFAVAVAPSFLIQLIVSPLSSVFNATNRVKTASIWQTTYFITTFTTLGVSAIIFELPIDRLLLVYVIHELVLYTAYFLLQWTTLKNILHVRNFGNRSEGKQER